MEENWLSLKKQAIQMRFNWEIGRCYEAGEYLGEVFKTLIGEHEWIDHMSHPEDGMDFERYPLADFYSAFFEELHGQNFKDEIQECLIPDELHMRAHDLAINAMLPLDQFNYDKYFAVIQTLGEYNWARCHENQELSAMLKNDADQWNGFWEQEDVDEISDKNLEKNAKEIEEAIENLQYGWHMGEPLDAGISYAKFRKLLTQPKEKENAE